MNFNLRKLIAKIFIIGSLLMPVAALAVASTFPVPPCDSLTLRCDSIDSTRPVTSVLTRIINVLLGIAFLIAVLFLIYGGFQYVFAGGSEDKAKAGRKTVLNSLIGIAIIILSYIIVQIVVRAVSQAGQGTGQTI